MLALAAGLWLLVRPYAGISQDALLYSFQAFARLHPESLGGDIFLANLSQDAFTVFPAIHGAAIRLWGLEGAALLLTLVGQAWWFVAAAIIAHRLVGPRLAGLSIGLLAAVPGYYGAYEVFRYAEPFITSRLYSEALVLTGIGLLLHGRRPWALAATVAALLVHPLMGVAGVLVVASVVIGRRGTWVIGCAVLGGVVASIALSRIHPVYPLEIFDPAWLGLARSRSPFLLVQDWNAETWAVAGRALTLAVLAALASGTASGRRLLVGGATVGAAGLLTTVVGASLAHVVLLVQGQAWRWLWLTQVLALVAAPRTFQALWDAGAAHRAALLFFIASWLVSGWAAVVLDMLALVCAVAGWITARVQLRPLFLVSVVAVAVSLIAYVVTRPGSLPSSPSTILESAWWIDGILPVAVVVVCWHAIGHVRIASATLATTAIIAVLAVYAAIPGWGRVPTMPETTRSAFSAWRGAIPMEAEVYWPQHVDVVWFVLERRSYLSHLQTAGVLFSRQTTMELSARSTFTSPDFPQAVAFGDGAAGIGLRMTEPGIKRTCQAGGADFVVSADSIDLPQAAVPVFARLERGEDLKEYRLFDCAAIRLLDEKPA